jgi:hypothetical protein
MQTPSRFHSCPYRSTCRMYKSGSLTRKVDKSALAFPVSPSPTCSTPLTDITMFTLAFMTVALGSIATLVAADTHHITVNNKCGYGTPTMYGPAQNAPFKNVSAHDASYTHTLTSMFEGSHQHIWRLF